MHNDLRTLMHRSLRPGMKFHLNTADGNVFTGHGDGFVRIGETDYRENLLVTPEQLIGGWAPGGFDALDRIRLRRACGPRARSRAVRQRARRCGFRILA